MPEEVKASKSLCSGILLNEEYVLTAATCLPQFYNDDRRYYVNISVGSNDLAELYDTSIHIEKIIQHPKFSYGNPYEKNLRPFNDLSLGSQKNDFK